MMHIFRVFSLLVAALFLTVPAGAQENYRIQPGDTLNIEVLEDPQLNRQVLVLPDGRFSFPYAGTVLAGGRTLGQVERAVTTGIASNFAIPPNVFVAVQRRSQQAEGLAGSEGLLEPIQIYFIGEVSSPGRRTVAEGTTLLQALAQSGGFTRFAAQKRIQLRRTNPTTGVQSLFRINYKALANGAEAQNIRLQDGDVILAPERRLFE
ncbi:polysaccharide biosynthesis/export family protein [uncultured Roseobacter sp.]|uniref:polysaccharide biosynthesis/export family protein n=1 Tax=uncultured Roseobacter sp. TaxID=114847 RepID=UPI00263078C9|nr:polysaccharide biosynthesis/export family protein [uncultured Roseobacter sp.]